MYGNRLSGAVDRTTPRLGLAHKAERVVMPTIPRKTINSLNVTFLQELLTLWFRKVSELALWRIDSQLIEYPSRQEYALAECEDGQNRVFLVEARVVAPPIRRLPTPKRS